MRTAVCVAACVVAIIGLASLPFLGMKLGTQQAEQRFVQSRN